MTAVKHELTVHDLSIDEVNLWSTSGNRLRAVICAMVCCQSPIEKYLRSVSVKATKQNDADACSASRQETNIDVGAVRASWLGGSGAHAA